MSSLLQGICFVHMTSNLVFQDNVEKGQLLGFRIDRHAWFLATKASPRNILSTLTS